MRVRWNAAKEKEKSDISLKFRSVICRRSDRFDKEENKSHPSMSHTPLVYSVFPFLPPPPPSPAFIQHHLLRSLTIN